MRDTQRVLIERDLLLRMGDVVIHNKYRRINYFVLSKPFTLNGFLFIVVQK